MNKQYGLSLIELMIAVLISCLLILGVTQMFGNTSQTDRTSSAIARVQESGRVALEVIGEDARRAGYQGCSSAANTTVVGSYTFPAQAISASSNSVTFRFATLENTGTAFSTKKACDGTALYLKSVTYAQCANGTSLCQGSTAILDNAVISGISFGVLSSGNIQWIDSGTITAAQIADAHSVRVSLTISDTLNKVTRTYANTYELRNRL